MDGQENTVWTEANLGHYSWIYLTMPFVGGACAGLVAKSILNLE